MILDILRKFPENRLQILICLVVIIVETFLNSISLTLIIPVVDQLVNNKVDLNFQIINLSFLEKYFNFFNIMVFFLFIFLFKFLISIFNSVWTSNTIESIRLNLAYFYIYHHQNTKYEDVIKQKKGAVLNDVTKVANNTGIFIFSYLKLLNCYLHILFILLFVIFIEYRVMFFFLFVLLIWFSLGKKYLNWSYNLGEKIILYNQQKNVFVEQLLNNIKDIKLLNQSSLYNSKFFDILKILKFNKVKQRIGRDLPIWIVNLIGLIFVIIVIIFFNFNEDNFKKDIPVYFYIFIASLTLIYKFSDLTKTRFRVDNLKPSFIYFFNKLSEIKLNLENINFGNKELKKIDKIELCNLSFKFNERAILRNVNLLIKEPKIICITGESGSGKSTILDLILRLYEPTAGKILLNDISINEFSKFEIRSSIGYVTQNPAIINNTLRENLKFGLNVDDNYIMNTLNKLGLSDFIAEFDEGLETIINEDSTNISGGQRKKISLIRIMIRRFDIVLLDETTGSISEDDEERIFNSIKKMSNKIIIVISHRKKTFKLSDEVYQILDNKLVDWKND